VKKKLICLTVAMLIGGGFGVAANAASQPSTDDQQVAALRAQTDKLEKELASLRSQVKQLSTTQHVQHRAAAKPYHHKAVKMVKGKSYITETTVRSWYNANPKDPRIDKILSTVRYAHGLAVVTSPFVGKTYSPFDLITNISSTNTDVLFLKQRKALEDYAHQHGEIVPSRPVLDLSGAIEAKATSATIVSPTFSASSNNTTANDINLNRVEFDAIAEAGPWATGAIMINYEDKFPQGSSSNSPNYRMSNSRVKVDRAFLTIGNLNRSPIYGTAGQFIVPFGTYSSYLLVDSLPKYLGRIKERAAEIGFSCRNGLYGAVYGFKGDSFVGNKATINNWGANFGYSLHPSDYLNVLRNFNLATDFGVGYVANMADAKFLQENYFGTVPAGSPAGTNFEKLQNRVPAVDAHLSLDLKPFHLFSEFVTAVRSFNVIDMSYNGRGATPRAFEIEGSYNFPIFKQNYAFTVGYNRSWQSLGVNLPKDRYAAVLSTSFWAYTVETLEYYHDVNYGSGETGGTQAGVITTNGRGRTANAVTLQVGVYF